MLLCGMCSLGVINFTKPSLIFFICSTVFSYLQISTLFHNINKRIGYELTFIVIASKYVYQPGNLLITLLVFKIPREKCSKYYVV